MGEKLDIEGKSSRRGELSGARWEMEWPASSLDTIMATRLFPCPAKWLDAFAGRDSSVARWLSLKRRVRIMNMWLL